MRKLLTTSLLFAATACGGGDRQDSAAADSLSRDLQLAPAESTAALNDRPADTAAATPAPAPEPARTATPAPRTPSRTTSGNTDRSNDRASSGATTPSSGSTASATRTLSSGASFAVTTGAEFGSHKNKVGDEVTATVAADVKNSRGQVVIPAGSKVTMAITALRESENKSDSTGTLTLSVRSVSIGGNSYPLDGRITGLNTELRGRSTGAGDVAKVGAGAGVGAVAGRVLGGSTKGAVIGGIIGGAVGAQRAVETKDRDVVVPAGSRVTITLEDTFTRTTT